jgi:hypothetical protein
VGIFRGTTGEIMQGLLETSQDFYLWDINPVDFRPLYSTRYWR